MSTRVMVVDDSRVVHAQMKKLLTDTKYEIIESCRNGESALDAYEHCLPDIVTMDIVMPGMDGLVTARKILEKDPNAKIVMVSSLAYDDTINEAEKIGAKGFVYKPFDREVLLESLDQAMVL